MESNDITKTKLLVTGGGGFIGSNFVRYALSELQNIEIVHLLCDILDRKLSRNSSSRKLVKIIKDQQGHDRRYPIDASKIKDALGWTPKYEFQEAIERTVDWYLDNMDWVNSVRSGKYREWIELNYEKHEV